MSFTADTYKRITGMERPKPFALRSEKERDQALDRFLAAVASSSNDEAVDDLFRGAQMTPALQQPVVAEDVNSNAA